MSTLEPFGLPGLLDRTLSDRHCPAAQRLIDSEPAPYAPWQHRCVVERLREARSVGLDLPETLLVRFRRGGPGCADAAFQVDSNGALALYFSVVAKDLPHSCLHEAGHVHLWRRGISQQMTLEAEEKLVDDFAYGLAALPR